MPSSHYRSVFRPDLFTGQVLWVTGGGSGIGRCVAHELASLGAKVVISGRSPDKLARVVGEIADDGGHAHALAFDIRDEDAVKTGVASVIQQYGPVSGLVNNAGGQFPSPLMAISKKGFDAVVANNLTGGFLMMRELFNQSMQQHGGAIVNMTADFRNGMPGMGHSGAARAGMSNLTQTAAFEWAHAGVRVNAVAPGWIASSGMDSYGPAMRSIIPKLKDHVPLKRMGAGSRSQRGHRLPAVAGRRLHHRRHAADRRRRLAGQRDLPARKDVEVGALRRLPPRHDTRGTEVMPALGTNLDPRSAAFESNSKRMAERLAEVRRLEAMVVAESASKADKFAKRGQLLPRERVARLLDRGSDVPRAQPAGRLWACTTTTAARACSAAAASSASARWPASAC